MCDLPSTRRQRRSFAAAIGSIGRMIGASGSSQVAPCNKRNVYMKAHTAIVLVTATSMSCGSAYAKHPKPSDFENAEIRVEQNATDGDTEVVIFAKGGDDGFKHFRVRSPDRRTVVATFSLDRTVR